MNTFTDSLFISKRQLAPEHFPIHLDPQLYDSKKLAEIAIFKGACQKLSELANLIDLLKNRKLMVVVEIGTYKGGCFWLWCQLAQPDALIVSIDLPGGDFGGGFSEETMEVYRAYGREKQSLHFLRRDSHLPETRLELEALLQGRPIDLLTIDGDHRYEGVKSDFKLYSSLVREGGLIAFHDILFHPRVSACEVERLWKEISPHYQNVTFTESNDDRGWGQWGGIGVLTYSRSVEVGL